MEGAVCCQFFSKPVGLSTGIVCCETDQMQFSSSNCLHGFRPMFKRGWLLDVCMLLSPEVPLLSSVSNTMII